jgi:hypothetical protein
MEGHWKKNTSTKFVFLMKLRFMYVEQSIGTIAMNGVKILTKLLNLSVIHQRSVCGAL